MALDGLGAVVTVNGQNGRSKDNPKTVREVRTDKQMKCIFRKCNMDYHQTESDVKGWKKAFVHNSENPYLIISHALHCFTCICNRNSFAICLLFLLSFAPCLLFELHEFSVPFLLLVFKGHSHLQMESRKGRVDRKKVRVAVRK